MPNACHVELAVETRKCQIQQNQVMPYPNRNSQPSAKQIGCHVLRTECLVQRFNRIESYGVSLQSQFIEISNSAGIPRFPQFRFP